MLIILYFTLPLSIINDILKMEIMWIVFKVACVGALLVFALIAYNWHKAGVVDSNDKEF